MSSENPKGYRSVRFPTLLELAAVALILPALVVIGASKLAQSDIEAKVAEVNLELSNLAEALELYALDFDGRYPFDLDSRGWPWVVTDCITTPVAYLVASSTDELEDPFKTSLFLRYRYMNFVANANPGWPPCPFPTGGYTLRWVAGLSSSQVAEATAAYGEWRLLSVGPDGVASGAVQSANLPYDPTNGTVSDGDIYLSQLDYLSSAVRDWKGTNNRGHKESVGTIRVYGGATSIAAPAANPFCPPFFSRFVYFAPLHFATSTTTARTPRRRTRQRGRYSAAGDFQVSRFSGRKMNRS
jgi:hypothetical protein